MSRFARSPLGLEAESRNKGAWAYWMLFAIALAVVAPSNALAQTAPNGFPSNWQQLSLADLYTATHAFCRSTTDKTARSQVAMLIWNQYYSTDAQLDGSLAHSPNRDVSLKIIPLIRAGVSTSALQATVQRLSAAVSDPNALAAMTFTRARIARTMLGLKYVVNAQSYARMLKANSVTDPTSLTDSQVATYASKYFEYDSSQRVTKETAQKAGCSCSGGSGQGTFTYSRATNTNGGYSDQYYNWKYRTIETLPDSNTNTIYSNYKGMTILTVFTDTTTGNKWGTFYLYDSRGHRVWQAMPSAVNLPSSLSTLEAYNDLLHNTSGTYTPGSTTYAYLNNSTGLINVTDYATSTTATTSTPGNVQDYLMDQKVLQGQTSTPVEIASQTYIVHSADKSTAGDGLGGTIYPVAAVTQYNGTTSPVTTYSYTFANSGTLATNTIASKTITKPLIGTGQNGPGGSAYDVSTEVFDSSGRLQWTQDGDGYINYYAHDPVTGAVTEQVIDVNTSSLPSGVPTPPSGWSTPTGGGLQLISTYSVDARGRTTKATDPNGNVKYIVYLDSSLQVRTYPGWQSGSGTPTGPTQVQRQDRSSATVYNESLTMSATPHLTSGVPDGTESIGSIQTLSRQYLDNSGRTLNSDTYFNWGSLTYSNSTMLGTQNTNFYRTSNAYDAYGRQYHTVNQLGTITDRVYDARNRVISTWIGTNDSPSTGTWSPTNNSAPCNMVEVSSVQYDNGNAGGDSLVTQTTTYVDSTSSDNRIAGNWYDWRDRLVATKSGLILSGGSESLSSENDGTHRQLQVSILDTASRVTESDTYDGDFVAASISSGSLSLSSGYSGYLRAKTVSSYDDQNRVYQTQTYSVDQSSGSVSTYALASNIFYNHRGQTIETSAPGGLVQKTVYDGAGRTLRSYSTDGGVVNSASYAGTWSGASNISSDLVLEESINTYDSNGNVILNTNKQHNHDDSNTGELGNASTTPKCRVSYVASYFDAINRVTAMANVGTNGGSSYTRPSSVASRSSTNLVTSYTYNSSTGYNDTITDPKGIITAKYYDMMGRVIRQIEAYDGVTVPTLSTLPTPTNTTDRATVRTFDGLGHTLTLEAVMPSSTNSQTTQYNYGVTTSGSSNLNSNDLLSYVQYPNASTGNPGTGSGDKQTYTYNIIGQQLTYLDQNGTTHTYTYDLLGRKTSDSVAVASGNPKNVDTTVLAMTTAFDTGGRMYQLTSYNSATGRSSGNIVNQVEDLYNGLGQLIDEYQAHGGAVNTSTSPVVVYSWNLMASGANNSRLTSMQYPNGRVLHYVYNSGLDTTISRVSGLADDNGSGSPASPDLEDYSYLGQGSIIQRAHGQPGLNLSYIQQSGDSSYTNDGGDQYTGLDRFGRVIDHFWTEPSGPTTTDRFQYAYDNSGNALYKKNLAISGLSELYHGNSSTSGDNSSAYDNLNRLGTFVRGALSASGNNGSSGLGSYDTVSSPSSLSSHNEAWSLDALGNWGNQTIDGTGTTRGHNSKNEVTSVGGNSLTFDYNGNTTTDQAANTYTYDAWNRLISVTNSSSTVLATYAYDPHGWRIQETHSSTTTDCYFNSGWQLIEERQSSTTTNQYVWSQAYIDCLVLRDDNSTSGNLGISGSGLGRRMYAQQDANWNTTALVDTSGNVQERFIYDPYGNNQCLTSGGSSTTDTYGWTYFYQGGRLTNIAGIYLFQHRDYSAMLGRWMETDPMIYVDSLDLYLFCSSNPMYISDPTGDDLSLTEYSRLVLDTPLDNPLYWFKETIQWNAPGFTGDLIQHMTWTGSVWNGAGNRIAALETFMNDDYYEEWNVSQNVFTQRTSSAPYPTNVDIWRLPLNPTETPGVTFNKTYGWLEIDGEAELLPLINGGHHITTMGDPKAGSLWATGKYSIPPVGWSWGQGLQRSTYITWCWCSSCCKNMGGVYTHAESDNPPFNENFP